ncbi:MAG: hypothetical protein HY680_07600 [Chloroflexi bacterium]|nr:hypothetical protein [Chloroflexota bacterium]
MVFLLGFLSGIVANQVFGMITRALPQTWVRWRVELTGAGYSDELMGFTQVVVHVEVTPPVWWKRLLMEPMSEYLVMMASLDGNRKGQRVPWTEGDAMSYLFRIDAPILRWAQILSCTQNGVFLCDRYPQDRVPDGEHRLQLVVNRAGDGEADSMTVVFEVKGNEVEILGFED